MKEVIPMATDPVCGMEVQPEKAAGQSEHKGQTYYFCCLPCKQRFDQDPQPYARKATEAQQKRPS